MNDNQNFFKKMDKWKHDLNVSSVWIDFNYNSIKLIIFKTFEIYVLQMNIHFQ